VDNSSHKTDRFTAPGCGILGAGGARIQGASFASPIVAGIAALILEFAKQPPLEADTSVYRHFRKREGMVRIFKKMSIQKTAEDFMFLQPWELLRDPENTYGGDGGPWSVRFHVAWDIINELKK
jgi:subtilisin family serine protease